MNNARRDGRAQYQAGLPIINHYTATSHSDNAGGIAGEDISQMEQPGQVRLPDGKVDTDHERPDPLLVTARQAAEICGKSLRTWRTWDAAGLIPQPVRIGRSTLWRLDELRAWVEAGCPRREQWEARTC